MHTLPAQAAEIALDSVTFSHHGDYNSSGIEAEISSIKSSTTETCTDASDQYSLPLSSDDLVKKPTSRRTQRGIPALKPSLQSRAVAIWQFFCAVGSGISVVGRRGRESISAVRLSLQKGALALWQSMCAIGASLGHGVSSCIGFLGSSLQNGALTLWKSMCAIGVSLGHGVSCIGFLPFFWVVFVVGIIISGAMGKTLPGVILVVVGFVGFCGSTCLIG